jgi:hypothetical protein
LTARHSRSRHEAKPGTKRKPPSTQGRSKPEAVRHPRRPRTPPLSVPPRVGSGRPRSRIGRSPKSRFREDVPRLAAEPAPQVKSTAPPLWIHRIEGRGPEVWIDRGSRFSPISTPSMHSLDLTTFLCDCKNLENKLPNSQSRSWRSISIDPWTCHLRFIFLPLSDRGG